MKRLLLTLALLVVITQSAHARPQFFFFNSSWPDNAPAKFGYDVTATLKDTNVVYNILLSAAASKAFRSADLVFYGPDAAKPKVHIDISTDKSGQKRIQFSLPSRYLNRCTLQIDSAPLHKDHALLRDFAGYRLPLDINTGEASLAALSDKMKPRQTLPAKFKSSQDIVRDMEIFASLGKDSVWWQEFRFGRTLQLLVIWFDASPPQMSSQRFVEYAYYHDGTNWRFHSTSRSPVAGVSVDPQKQTFVFLSSRGQQIKSIPFKDVYKEQIKKLLEKERKDPGDGK